MHSYLASGLAVASEVDLPGFEPHALDSSPDVAIRLGDVPTALPGAEHTGPNWQISGRCVLLRLPDLARFLVRDGREIIAQAEGATPLDDLSAFLGGSVFGILLHQRRQIVLHASAIVVNGGAVLFCGPSGAGKSTLAAMLVERGYRFAADDLGAISVSGTEATLWPDGRRMKLWRDTIAALHAPVREIAPVRQRVEKFLVEPHRRIGAPVPVGAIYVLREARAPHRPGIVRPNVVDAAGALVRSAYRPLLVRAMAQRPLYFEAGTRLAGLGLVHTLTRALDFAANEQAIAGLEAHWRTLGLLERAA